MLKKQENGRSMIEMLGVLAIIGVLSVAGIAGYTSAMNKHRANELLHQVSMRATSCVAQMAVGSVPNVNDFDDYDGYSFTAAPVTGQNKFTITISGKEISETVCNNIKNALPSDVEMSECGATNASITLTFASGTVAQSCSLDGVSCTSNSDCCNGNCNSDGYCGNDGCQPNGTENPYNCCGEMVDNVCVSCIPEQKPSFSATACCSGKWSGLECLPDNATCVPDGYAEPTSSGNVTACCNYSSGGFCVGCIEQGEAFNNDLSTCCYVGQEIHDPDIGMDGFYCFLNY